MKKVFGIMIFVGMISLGIVSTVGAASRVHPCSEDVKKFCRDVQPGEGRLQKCLKKHKKEINPACYAKLKEAKKEMKRVVKACKKDTQEFCSDVNGRSQQINCLRAHDKKLSMECREETRKGI